MDEERILLKMKKTCLNIVLRSLILFTIQNSIIQCDRKLIVPNKDFYLYAFSENET